MTTLVELCCGTAAVSLWAMGRLKPLTGFMGSKQRDAARLCSLLGARDPSRVLLVDGGPWGDVWQVLQHADARRAVAEQLRAWDRIGSLPEVWLDLVKSPPSTEPAERVAQYLCLQARTASCIPVWWSETGWVSSAGGGTAAAAKRMKTVAQRTSTDGSPQPRGLVRISTLATRVDRLASIDWRRVTVVHGKPEWLTMSAAPARAVAQQLSLDLAHDCGRERGRRRSGSSTTPTGCSPSSSRPATASTRSPAGRLKAPTTGTTRSSW